MPTRRQFLQTAPLLVGAGANAQGRIDRQALVRRHNPVFRDFDPRGPLSVGNGEFAFNADATGLQTFPELYEKTVPLCTQSQWGWHTFPVRTGLDLSKYEFEEYEHYGRKVPYGTRTRGQAELYNWLRENPHRLHLGRIGFAMQQQDVSAIEQTLDLWTGTLLSKFRHQGRPVTVTTVCHPRRDLVAFTIEAPPDVEVIVEFPYGSPTITAADWSKPDAHTSAVTRKGPQSWSIERQLDRDRYFAAIAASGTTSTQTGPHRISFRGAGKFTLSVAFSPGAIAAALPTAEQTGAASRLRWNRFWSEGGAIDLSGAGDRSAEELERRIVLSQYLTAIQCSGSVPPQETGLTCNSWYGKFHLEMHWWHAVHFPLWGRAAMLARSMPWYRKILPAARAIAKQQGYAGARWPKMTSLDGRDSPSPIGPLLIWQQPHPIAYCELLYQTNPTRATLQAWREIVFETAEFMASYAHLDEGRGRYVLGPPVIPAQENHPPRDTWNPTFELVYWEHALGIAQRWRERLGMAKNPKWEDVRAKLSPLPQKDGVYLAHENAPQTFTERNRDHPSFLCALGVLPGAGVDRETMRRTLKKTFDEWRWPDTWGWDYPVTAMTAARLGEPELAIRALLMDTPKNVYLPNGHNYQRPGLGLYLPGNGGLLSAVALMAAGWVGGPAEANPGFPKSWNVRSEGLRRLL